MEVERLGKVRVGDGAYARELQQRAIQEGMTVMVEKTIEGNVRYHEIFNLSGPRDNWPTLFNQGSILETKVNMAVAEGELVIMTFSRPKS